MPPFVRSVWPLTQAPSDPAWKATTRDILRLCQALQRRRLGDSINEFLRFANEEQLGRGGTGGDRVDREVAAPHLLGQHGRLGLHRRLGRGIGAVGRLQEGRHAEGEVHDPSAVAQAACRLPHGVEAALEVDCDRPVKQSVVALSDRRQMHGTAVLSRMLVPPKAASALSNNRPTAMSAARPWLCHRPR
jgi:hypothetical protein